MATILQEMERRLIEMAIKGSRQDCERIIAEIEAHRCL